MIRVVQTDAVGDLSINFKGFFGDAAALVRTHRAKGAHIVQSVGQFDDDDAHVFSHGEDQFAETFRLMLGMIFKFEFFQFGEAVYHFGNGIAEFRRHFDFGYARVFQYIVHNACAKALNIHVPNRKLRGNGKGMGDVGFAALTGLSVMGMKSVGNGFFKLGLFILIEIRCGAKQKIARFCCQRVIRSGRQWGWHFQTAFYGYFLSRQTVSVVILHRYSPHGGFIGLPVALFVACQKLGSDLSGCDFAQGGYGWFVVANVVNQRRIAVFQLACATGGNEGKVEVVRDFTCAVFSSNTCHVCLLSFYVSNKRLFSLFFTNFPTGLR